MARDLKTNEEDMLALPEATTGNAADLRAQAEERLIYSARNGRVYAPMCGQQMRRINHAVFHMIGGIEAYALWALDNKDDFYTKIMPKLLDRQVDVTEHRTIEHVVRDLDEEIVEAITSDDYGLGVIDVDFDEV